MLAEHFFLLFFVQVNFRIWKFSLNLDRTLNTENWHFFKNSSKIYKTYIKHHIWKNCFHWLDHQFWIPTFVQANFGIWNMEYGLADTLIPSSFIYFTYLTYMEGIGPCEPIWIVFRYYIKSHFTSLNINFNVNRTFHVKNSLIYRFDWYGRYQILWTDIAHFQYRPAYG